MHASFHLLRVLLLLAYSFFHAFALFVVALPGRRGNPLPWQMIIDSGVVNHMAAE